jgi:hypothetical protein
MSMGHMYRICIAATAATALLACATHQPVEDEIASGSAVARGRYMWRRAADHNYSRSLGEVWPSVRQLLLEHGYVIQPSPDGSFVIHTQWRLGARERTRYVIVGHEPSPGHCRVRVTREHHWLSQSPDFTLRSRDLALEWQLLSRVEPEAASRIMADADSGT